MKQGTVFEAKTMYEEQRTRLESNRVLINVKCALQVPKCGTNKPIVSITGQGKACVPFAGVFVGKVISSQSGFVAGTRVVAFGYSDASIQDNIIDADYRVVASIPYDVEDYTVLFSGFAAHWVDMIQTTNPPLGSSIRVNGENKEMVTDILKKMGFDIVEDERESDYFFPADGQTEGESDHQISWKESCGADWNDDRLFNKAYVFPRAYVNHTVIDNLKTFWMCMKGTNWRNGIWPVDSISEHEQSERVPDAPVTYIPEDEEYLKILGDVKADLACRRKPVTVCMIIGTKNSQDVYASSLKKMMAWIGSMPTKITCNKERKCIQIAFMDGSVGTIQFIDNQVVDHAQLHFDGKSIFIDQGKVVPYDCSGIGEVVYRAENSSRIKMEREKVVNQFEKQ